MILRIEKAPFKKEKGALTDSCVICFSPTEEGESAMASVRPQREQKFVLGQETTQLNIRIKSEK